jgi:hypothetical protein
MHTAVRARCHLVTVPMDDVSENAIIVNGVQRHATVVVQKSLLEGFGLTVTEAMWMSRPVVASAVGGIQDQIADGKERLLLPDPRSAGFRAPVAPRCPQRSESMPGSGSGTNSSGTGTLSSTSICSTSSSSRALPRWSIIMQIEVAAFVGRRRVRALGRSSANAAASDRGIHGLASTWCPRRRLCTNARPAAMDLAERISLSPAHRWQPCFEPGVIGFRGDRWVAAPRGETRAAAGAAGLADQGGWTRASGFVGTRDRIGSCPQRHPRLTALAARPVIAIWLA